MAFIYLKVKPPSAFTSGGLGLIFGLVYITTVSNINHYMTWLSVE